MNKDDEIREELSDLWCKEITGQLKGSEKIRLQNLIEEREFPSETMERGELQISFSEKKVYQNGQEILLNRHEYDTLVYLARHPGWVRSKEQIYEAVWTEEVENYENAVMWCISQLRKKLEPDPDRLQYIHTVKGVGYKFEYRKNKN